MSDNEFPKWVAPHPSHVVGRVAPEFPDTHVDRDGGVTVLVRDIGEETTALAEKVMSVVETPLLPFEDHGDNSEPETIAYDSDHEYHND